LMNIFNEDSIIKNAGNAIVTVGTFDGVHLGHSKIFKEVLFKTGELGGSSWVITFYPHPRKVVQKGYDIKLLTPLEEKMELFENEGIENVLVVNFTKEFSLMTSEEFARKILAEKIGAKHLIIGYDHKFGKDRTGDVELLKKLGAPLGFEVSSVPPVKINDEIISSTKIRRYLLSGNPVGANKMLGRNYSLSGFVVKGSKRGRTLGFPTANISLTSQDKLIPQNGVYLTKVYVKDFKGYGLLNIGYRPTFDKNIDLYIEVHILDFNNDIYGDSIKVEILEYLRPETKFQTKEKLIKQIELDRKKALNLVSKYS